MKRIDTMSIRDILRHHHDLGLPRAETAVAVSVSAGDGIERPGARAGGGSVMAVAVRSRR